MPSPNIPPNDDMYADILDVLHDFSMPVTKGALVEPLAKRYQLTDEQVAEMYESGNGPVFADRVQWALSYLNMANLMDKPKRGYYSLTDEAKALVGRPNEEIKHLVAARFRERNEARAAEASTQVRPSSTPVVANEEAANPQEALNESFRQLRAVRHQEILKALRAKTPAAFEKIVVRLLQRMGYGAEVANSGQVTQYGRDGGIDGIIREDVLGFGQIYIQAKRYAETSTTGRPEIQGFTGALAGAGATKGVFITTSSFSRDAINFAANLTSGVSLILIDGEQLASYIYEYGLGMQTEQTLELKRLDADYWDGFADE